MRKLTIDQDNRIMLDYLVLRGVEICDIKRDGNSTAALLLQMRVKLLEGSEPKLNRLTLDKCPMLDDLPLREAMFLNITAYDCNTAQVMLMVEVEISADITNRKLKKAIQGHTDELTQNWLNFLPNCW